MHARVYVRSPDIWFWVVVSAALVVGLTRVKPGLFETGLTPQLSCGLCVWGRLAFWPSPHVRSTERLRAADGQLKPERVFPSLVQMCSQLELEPELAFAFIWWKHPSGHEPIWVSNASSFSAASPSEKHEFKHRRVKSLQNRALDSAAALPLPELEALARLWMASGWQEASPGFQTSPRESVSLPERADGRGPCHVCKVC